MKKNLREKGITLIALVVTIIVLLILAGVTISLVLGQNGVMERAQYASNSWSNATKDEEAMMGKAESDVEDLTKDFVGGGNGGQQGGSAAALKVGTTDLSTVSDLSTMYGETVDYTSTSHPSITWQLFYADSSNYYIIASDYVPTSELPCSSESTGTDLNAPNGIADNQYKARFASSSSFNDYVMANSAYSTGGDSTAVVNNGLTSTYLKWVAYATTNSYAKNKVNMKAVAYMMDTNKWSSFADGVSGAKAMGGPTLEMFVKSYNAKHSTNQLGEYDEVSSINANSSGYMVKIGTGSWTGYVFGLDTANAGTDTAGNMWVRNTYTKASAYWLAAPSSLNGYVVRYVTYDGVVDGGNDTTAATALGP